MNPRPLLLRRPKVVFFGAQAEKKRFFFFFRRRLAMVFGGQITFSTTPKMFSAAFYFFRRPKQKIGFFGGRLRSKGLLNPVQEVKDLLGLSNLTRNARTEKVLPNRVLSI